MSHFRKLSGQRIAILQDPLCSAQNPCQIACRGTCVLGFTKENDPCRGLLDCECECLIHPPEKMDMILIKKLSGGDVIKTRPLHNVSSLHKCAVLVDTTQMKVNELSN